MTRTLSIFCLLCLSLFCTLGRVQAQTLAPFANDTLQGTQGANLITHTPSTSGGGWFVSNGSSLIFDGSTGVTMFYSNAIPYSFYKISQASSTLTFEVEADVFYKAAPSTSANEGNYVIAYAPGTQSGYYGGLYIPNSGQAQWQLGKGYGSNLISTNVTPTVGMHYHIRLDVSPGHQTLSVSAPSSTATTAPYAGSYTVVCTAADTSLTLTGQVGLYDYCNMTSPTYPTDFTTSNFYAADVVPASPHTPTAYYISPAGSNSNSGTSTTTAWQTVAAVNSFAGFGPGDTISFLGGSAFIGALSPTGGGTISQPVTLTSYGTGKATLSSTGAGITLTNTQGWVISNLILAGPGVTYNSAAGTVTNVPQTSIGIFINSTGTGGTALSGFTVNNCDVSGYYIGIMPQTFAATSPTPLDRITIANTAVHDCVEFGIWTQACTGTQNYSGEASNNSALSTTLRSLTNVVVNRCTVYNIFGDNYTTGTGASNTKTGTNIGENSGHAIVLGNVNLGQIDSCLGHDCGQTSSQQGGGPAGIWVTHSGNVVVRNCEFYHEFKTQATGDGTGFDIDFGCANVVFERDYCHDDDGAGFDFAGSATNSYFKECVSVNDGLNPAGGNACSGVFWYDTASGTSGVIGCTFVEGAGEATASPIVLSNSNFTGAIFANNIFESTNGQPLFSIASGLGYPTLLGNDYLTSGTFAVTLNGVTYGSLAALRASGLERYNAGGVFVPTGVSGDPLLAGPFTLPMPALLPLRSVSSLSAVNPLAGSPALDTGVDVYALLGLLPASSDLRFSTINAPGAAGSLGLTDIGAVEYPAAGYTSAASGTKRKVQ